jgi:hypothetical protein
MEFSSSFSSPHLIKKERIIKDENLVKENILF